jgi:hypothetical protein
MMEKNSMKKWTHEMVAERMEEAAETLKRLPMDGPRDVRSAWPPIIRDFWEAYGWDKAVVRLGPPSPDAIQRMDECLKWLQFLDVGQMRLVWAKAENLPWKTILPRIGAGRTKGWHLWREALKEIAFNLNAIENKVVRTHCSNKNKLNTMDGIC